MDQPATTYHSFLGTGWSFPLNFSKALQAVEMVSDEQDIYESLLILLGTSVGERFLQPRYGCNLNDFMFEPLDLSSQTILENMIKEAILIYEPRIKLLSVTVNLDNVLEGIANITVDYSVRSTNSRFNLVFPFYVNEATNAKV